MRERIWRSLLMIAVGTSVVILIVFFDVFYHQSVTQIRTVQIESLAAITEDIDEMLAIEDTYHKINFDTAYMVRLRNILQNGFASGDSEIRTRANAVRALHAIKQENASLIHSIYVVMMDGTAPYMLSDSGIRNIKYSNDASWQKEYTQAQEGDFCSFRVLESRHEGENDLLTFYHCIESKDWNSDNIVKGCIILNYHLKPVVQKLNHSAGIDCDYCLYDKKTGEYYSSLEAEEMEGIGDNAIRKLIEDGSDTGILPSGYVYFQNTLEDVPLGCFLLCQSGKLYRRLWFQLGIIAAAVMAIIACYILFFIIYRNQSRKYLNNILNLIEASGDEKMFPASASVSQDQARQFAHVLGQRSVSRQEMQEILQAERNRSVEMEMLALQSQMNPHFLLNTIDFIYWNQVGEKGFSDEQSVILEDLSRLLKYSMDYSSALVSLEEELKHVDIYLDIQNRRKAQKAEALIEIPKELTALMVPKLIIQPLIENSYKYAADTETDCVMQIRISARMEGEDLVITVQDSGKGLPVERLEELNRKFEHGQHQSTHIGLSNINRRLQLFYGSSSGVRLSMADGAGLCVSLRMENIRRYQ